MRSHDRPLLWDVFLSHAVLCTFLGALVAVTWIHGADRISVLGAGHALANGAIVAAITAVFHFSRRYVNRTMWAGPRDRHLGRRMLLSIAVAFVCGAVIVMAVDRRGVISGVAVLTLVLVVVHVKEFFRRVVQLLAPGSYATWRDVGALLHVWATLIAAFTLINVSTGYVHELVGSGAAPFASSYGVERLVDYFYFTIVVMTTLGFGDIVPVTGAARVVVVAECLTSYVMFALSIGIMTRGIQPETESK